MCVKKYGSEEHRLYTAKETAPLCFTRHLDRWGGALPVAVWGWTPHRLLCHHRAPGSGAAPLSFNCSAAACSWGMQAGRLAAPISRGVGTGRAKSRFAWRKYGMLQWEDWCVQNSTCDDGNHSSCWISPFLVSFRADLNCLLRIWVTGRIWNREKRKGA